MNKPQVILSAQLPAISPKLIEVLGKLFPDRCPEPGTAPDALWFAAGQAYVVRYLKIIADRQSKQTSP